MSSKYVSENTPLTTETTIVPVTRRCTSSMTLSRCARSPTEYFWKNESGNCSARRMIEDEPRIMARVSVRSRRKRVTSSQAATANSTEASTSPRCRSETGSLPGMTRLTKSPVANGINRFSALAAREISAASQRSCAEPRSKKANKARSVTVPTGNGGANTTAVRCSNAACFASTLQSRGAWSGKYINARYPLQRPGTSATGVPSSAVTRSGPKLPFHHSSESRTWRHPIRAACANDSADASMESSGMRRGILASGTPAATAT